jgi:beta-glucosidase
MPYVCTINEPQMIAYFGYYTGTFPPAVSDPAAAHAVNTTLMAAHRRAVEVFRAAPGRPMIGTCLQLVPMEPLRPEDPDDVAAAAMLQELFTDAHLRDLAAGGDVGDFVGLQYYTRAYVDAREPGLLVLDRAGNPTTQMGWEIHPEGFGTMLRRCAQVGLPVLVTENGIATDDDDERVTFLSQHLAELKAALDDGVRVLGYLHWSAFDNFEWNHGYAPTFGLIGIDRERGLARTPRPSAHVFGAVARSGRMDALARRPLRVGRP